MRDASELGKWRDRLSHQVMDLSRALSRSLQIRLMDHEVSIGYWRYLRTLWERDGITQRELSELAGLSEPTTHNAVIAMEKRGYVIRHRAPGNMRKKFISLTPKGRALESALVPLARDLNEVAIRGIPASDIEVVRRTIAAMLKNLEEDESTINRSLPPLRKLA